MRLSHPAIDTYNRTGPTEIMSLKQTKGREEAKSDKEDNNRIDYISLNDVTKPHTNNTVLRMDNTVAINENSNSTEYFSKAPNTHHNATTTPIDLPNTANSTSNAVKRDLSNAHILQYPSKTVLELDLDDLK